VVVGFGLAKLAPATPKLPAASENLAAGPGPQAGFSTAPAGSPSELNAPTDSGVKTQRLVFFIGQGQNWRRPPGGLLGTQGGGPVGTGAAGPMTRWGDQTEVLLGHVVSFVCLQLTPPPGSWELGAGRLGGANQGIWPHGAPRFQPE
jgi:hypothetical protein